MPKLSTGGAIFFAAVFFLLILPPIFIDAAESNVASWTFPLRPFFHALLALALLYFFREKGGATNNANDARQNAETRRIKRIRAAGVSMTTFGFLCTCAAIIELTLRILKRGNAPVFPLPKNFSEYVWCILTFAFSSLYEETMYRFYVPEMLIVIFYAVLEKIAVNKNDKITRERCAVSVFSEASAVILFALAHRYLSFASVVNALLAGGALRICYKKSGGVWAGFAAHFAYNIISFALFAFAPA